MKIFGASITLGNCRWEIEPMRYIVIAGMCIGLGACGTPDPVYNTTTGGVGGAAVGCAVGAAVTAPLFGIGCIPGAIIGGSAGATAGAASTPPPVPLYTPPPAYY